MTNATRLGFIGLGSMGSAMATRLLDAGYAVAVFDTNAAACVWIDRHGGDEGLGDYRYNQIRMAVNGSYEPDRY